MRRPKIGEVVRVLTRLLSSSHQQAAIETPLSAPAGVPQCPAKANDQDGAVQDVDDNSGICVVCLDAESTHLFIPCGHRCVCAADAELLRRQGGSCPVCRQHVEGILRVYM